MVYQPFLGYLAALKVRSTERFAQHRPIQPTDSNGTTVTRDIPGIEEKSINTAVMDVRSPKT